MYSKAAILGGTPVFEKPIPFARPTLPPYEELESGFRSIIESGMVTKGEYLKEFEERAKKYLGVPYALGVANATLGLYMLLKSLNIKGEVIVPSFSFMATFHVIEATSLTPVFVDCERDTFTIDPVKVEEAITDKTEALVGVNIFGNPPDMKSLGEIARKRNLKFIMDSAHSFGTLYDGHPMGGYGDGEVFSTSATKLLATGEGGVLTTSCPGIHKFVEVFREYGNAGDYDAAVAGINGRMSEFHALLGLKLVENVEKFAIARNLLARFYREELSKIPGLNFQKIRDGCRSSYKDFALIVDETGFCLNRDQLSKSLAAEGIPTRKYFHPPGHRLSIYRKYAARYGENLVNTDFISSCSLMLPIYSHMPRHIAVKIAEAVERIYNCREEIARLDLATQVG